MTYIKSTILFLSVVIAFPVFASVSFKCYSVPNIPVQAYEYASSNCGGIDSANASKNIGKNEKKSETKEVLCMYQALCQTSDDNSNAEPPTKTISELTADVANGNLKSSILVCKAPGQMDDKGMISDVHCPSPTKCQKDIFYNFTSRSMSPGTPIKAVVPGKVGATY